MIKTLRYKLHPTIRQAKALNQVFGCCRYVYNWGLRRKIEKYERSRKTIGYVELAHELTVLKKELEWLNDVPVVCLQQSLRNLDAAFVRFFREKKGFPKLKSKHLHRDSAKYITNVHFDFDKSRIKIPKIGWVKLCKNRDFDQCLWKQGTLTVSRDAVGDYWCSIVLRNKDEYPETKPISEETAVGIDLGIKDYVILSDGTKYGNPKFLEKGQKLLKRRQRAFTRTKKGSKRHEKKRIVVSKLHRRIAERRKDFLHKLSTDIVNRFETVCLEDLNVEGMMKNHRLAQSIQSAAWNEFRRQLEYKCRDRGRNLVFIGRFEPSSKTCHHCGYINRELTLSDRKWTCPECKNTLDRDVNAAINIRNFALHKQNLIGTQVPK